MQFIYLGLNSFWYTTQIRTIKSHRCREVRTRGSTMVETGKLDLSATTLRQAEERALKTFVGRLQGSFPDQLHQVSLFGSKARGESDADSDVDVLIIINQDNRSLRREIIDIDSDL